MYATIIFTALFATQSFASDRLSPGKEFGTGPGFDFQVMSDSELRKFVEGAVVAIDGIARSNWTAEQKLTAIKQRYEKTQSYRARVWSRSPSTEMKLDLLIKPYESFPEAIYYRKQNCKSYYSTLKTDWEPTASAMPTLKGVKRAWDNLKAICEG